MKRILYVLSMFVVLSTVPFSTQAKTGEPVKLTDEQIELRVAEIKNRVEEIRAMDKSDLTRAQRKELRTELREMKKQANAISNGGVYLSLGAIIIIILLLILLL